MLVCNACLILDHWVECLPHMSNAFMSPSSYGQLTCATKPERNTYLNLWVTCSSPSTKTKYFYLTHRHLRMFACQPISSHLFLPPLWQTLLSPHTLPIVYFRYLSLGRISSNLLINVSHIPQTKASLWPEHTNQDPYGRPSITFLIFAFGFNLDGRNVIIVPG